MEKLSFFLIFNIQSIQLRKFLHLLTVLILILFVSSCAKDELEAPTDASYEIRALEDGSIQDRKDAAMMRAGSSTLRGGGVGDDTDPEINDDDDEEDEDRNPDK